MSNLKIKITKESLQNYRAFWNTNSYGLNWNCLFNIPPWIETWLKYFGNQTNINILKVNVEDVTIGIAPLKIENNIASFIGSHDVCDYFDFVMMPGQEEYFLKLLFDHLRVQGISNLDLIAIRKDSKTYSLLKMLAFAGKIQIDCELVDFSYDMKLPNTWNDFLQKISKKNRHEIRRKMRRLQSAAKIEICFIEKTNILNQAMEEFLDLFVNSSKAKSHFMTKQMAKYFRELAFTMATANLLKLFFIELDKQPVASIICFDYQFSRYLYNNGWNSSYGNLSIGMLSKVFSIRDSIEKGLLYYDFLKGDERYKSQLGGHKIEIQRCQIKF